MSGLGAALIEDGAEILERLICDIEAEELLTIKAELIRDNWDPWKVQAGRNLTVLAFAMGVTLWDENWPELTKRAWVDDQWRFKGIRGTEPALDRALALWGYTLEQTITPPQGYYASEEFTADQRAAWLAQMPTLRVRLELAHGYGSPDEWFAGDGFAGEQVAGLDDGPILYARRGFLRKDGVDYPLDSVVLSTTVVDGTTTITERIAVPGRSTFGFFAGEDFAGDDRFAGAAEVEADLVTVSRDEATQTATSTLTLNTAKPGLVPLDVGFSQESDIGNAGPYFYAGDFAGDGFAGDDPARDMLVDVMHLFDPAVALPMTEGASFAGVDRVGIDQKTAELMVDLKGKAEPYAWIAGRSFEGEGCAVAEDPKAIDNALRAVEAARALRDTVLVNFAPRRPISFGDRITASAKFGDWVKDLL